MGSEFADFPDFAQFPDFPKNPFLEMQQQQQHQPQKLQEPLYPARRSETSRQESKGTVSSAPSMASTTVSSAMDWPSNTQSSGESAGEISRDFRQEFFAVAMKQASSAEQRELAETFRDMFQNKDFDPRSFEVDFGKMKRQVETMKKQAPPASSAFSTPNRRKPVARADSGGDDGWIVENNNRGENMAAFNHRRRASVGANTSASPVPSTGSGDHQRPKSHKSVGSSSLGGTSPNSSRQESSFLNDSSHRSAPTSGMGSGMGSSEPTGGDYLGTSQRTANSHSNYPGPPKDVKPKPFFELPTNGEDDWLSSEMDMQDSATITSEITGLTGVFSQMPTDFDSDSDFEIDDDDGNAKVDPYLDHYQDQIYAHPGVSHPPPPAVSHQQNPVSHRPYPHMSQGPPGTPHGPAPITMSPPKTTRSLRSTTSSTNMSQGSPTTMSNSPNTMYNAQNPHVNPYYTAHGHPPVYPPPPPYQHSPPQYHQQQQHYRNVAYHQPTQYQQPARPQLPVPVMLQARTRSKGGMSRPGRVRDANLKVRFGGVTVRDYERIMSDNPSCMHGPSIGIGWRFVKEHTTFVDEFERERGRDPIPSEGLILNRRQRELLLLDLGYSKKQIAWAVRMNVQAKNRRKQTVDNLGVSRMEEMAEKAGGAFKRALKLGRK